MGDMPPRLNINYEAGNGNDVEAVYKRLRDDHGWGYGEHLITDPLAVIRSVLIAAGVPAAPTPTVQARPKLPYRYYVIFTVAVKRDGGFDYMPAVRWLDLPGPIEGPEDTDRLCAEFAELNKPHPVENIRITWFEYIDGPS